MDKRIDEMLGYLDNRIKYPPVHYHLMLHLYNIFRWGSSYVYEGLVIIDVRRFSDENKG